MVSTKVNSIEVYLQFLRAITDRQLITEHKLFRLLNLLITA